MTLQEIHALVSQALQNAGASRLQADATPAAAALPAMQRFAVALTTDPRQGDRAAIQALKDAGLADAAIVALAQLVGFLSYQTRVVAGLKAMKALKGAA